MEREITLYTLDGVKDADATTHYFSTEDKIGLSMLRFLRAPCEDVVLIMHGLTTSTDMFIMPEHYNLVQYLLDNKFTDVWCFDYRMSNRHSYNMYRHRYNMDDIALFDYPPAIERIRQVAGNVRIHIIAHCLGAVSFAMSLFGKAVTNIASATLNSVSLAPRIPKWSNMKIRFAPFTMEYILGRPYMSPRWGDEPGITIGRLVAKANSLFHRECDVPSCHMLSLMWGSGWPALYKHENLDEVTHRRGGDLYGPCSMNYFRHVRKMVQSDNTAVKYEPQNPKYNRLPNNYFEHAEEIETPVLFMTGKENHVFTDSNIVCHQRLEKIVPGRHELHVFPDYGHQDVFMGKNNHIDIFPRLLQFINKHKTN
ncbi:MAG: alpha/beta fold hydrolase [bacterium]